MGTFLTPLDITIFFTSLAAVMALGLWAGWKEDTSDDYFLAGHTTRWWGVAGSIFGSNVSANHIIGMMGVGFSVGFAQSHFEISAIFGLLLLCYGFLPVYRRLNVYTLSEYLGRRYGESSRVLYAVIMILVIVVIQMVPGFYIGSRALNTLLSGGKTASAVAVVGEDGGIERIEFTAGRGYAEAPAVEIDLPPNKNASGAAQAVAEIGEITDEETDEQFTGVTSVTLSNPGAGYDAQRPPKVKLVGGADFSYRGQTLQPGDVNPQWYIVGIILMAVVTGTYTILGGLKAVIVTDVLQSIPDAVRRPGGRHPDLRPGRRRLGRDAGGRRRRRRRRPRPDALVPSDQPRRLAVDRRAQRLDGAALLLLGHQPVHRAARPLRPQRP